MLNRLFALLVAMILCTSVSYGDEKPMANGPEEGLRLFGQCDASLFQMLKKHPDLFGASVQVESRGEVATIAVPNTLSEKGHEQTFKPPVVAAGIRLLAWHNEVSYDVDIGALLFWGFKVEGDPATIAKRVNTVLPAGRKLASLGTFWARAEKRAIGDPIDAWRPGGESGVATQKGIVERVLMIEQDTPGTSSLYCSLQGSVTAPLLQILRPDLQPREYPQ